MLYLGQSCGGFCSRNTGYKSTAIDMMGNSVITGAKEKEDTGKKKDPNQFYTDSNSGLYWGCWTCEEAVLLMNGTQIVSVEWYG